MKNQNSVDQEDKNSADCKDKNSGNREEKFRRSLIKPLMEFYLEMSLAIVHEGCTVELALVSEGRTNGVS